MKNIQPHIILGKLLKNKLNSDDYGLYHYGNVNEIKTVMRESSVKTKLYPLIWCELPLTNPVQSPVGLTANLKVFLATPSRKEWLNDERQVETFEKVLNPLYYKFCDILKKSDSFQVIDRQINRNDLPNFYTSEIGTRDNKEKNQVEEYWDVVTLDFRAIVMGGKCEVEPIAPVNKDITLDFDYEDLGNNEYRLFWSTENAYRVYLNNEIVSNNGEKIVTVNNEEKGTFTLFAYNKDYKTAFETIIIDNTSVDPRLTYANRIGEDGGSIVGFDLLEDDINTPVGRKEGKLYAYNEDDYTVIRNGGAWEFTRDGVYREAGIDVPRFDWSNGKQDLLDERQSTNLNINSTDFSYNIGVSPDISGELTNIETPIYGKTAWRINHLSASAGSQFRLMDDSNQNNFEGDTMSIFLRTEDNNSYPIYFSWGPDASGVQITITPNWQRFEVTKTGTGGLFPQLRNNVSGQLITYLAIQMQYEELTPNASSPIITNGSIVTRPADIITNSQGQLSPGRYDTV